jgi:hypothetical protein
MLMQVDHDVAFKSEPASVPPRERRGKTGWPRLLRIGGKFAVRCADHFYIFRRTRGKAGMPA